MTAEQRLQRIANIILAVEDRCMSQDGPVANTRLSMTDEELRQIWLLASGEQQTGG